MVTVNCEHVLQGETTLIIGVTIIQDNVIVMTSFMMAVTLMMVTDRAQVTGVLMGLSYRSIQV